ncbi:MAG TPA: hypothetical protein VF808_10100 [Ktedonobacterales bacterium]
MGEKTPEDSLPQNNTDGIVAHRETVPAAKLDGHPVTEARHSAMSEASF